jgi:hypothetical protein
MGNKSHREEKLFVDPCTGNTALHEYGAQLAFLLDHSSKRGEEIYKRFTQLLQCIDVNEVNFKGETAVHCFLKNCEAHEFDVSEKASASVLFDRIIGELKKKGYLFTTEDEEGQSVLLKAFQAKLPSYLLQALLTHAPLNAWKVKDIEDNTLLHIAAIQPNTSYFAVVDNVEHPQKKEFMKYALSATNKVGETVYDIAFRSKSYSTVYSLIAGGINVASQFIRYPDILSTSDYMKLIRENYHSGMFSLDDVITPNGDTLLHLALKYNNDALVMYLLLQCVNVTIQNSKGETALDLVPADKLDILRPIQTVAKLYNTLQHGSPKEYLLTKAMLMFRPRTCLKGDFYQMNAHYICDLFIEELDIKERKAKALLTAEKTLPVTIEFSASKQKASIILPELYDTTLDKRFYASQLHKSVKLMIDVDNQTAKKFRADDGSSTDTQPSGFEFVVKAPGTVLLNTLDRSDAEEMLPLKYVQAPSQSTFCL